MSNLKNTTLHVEGMTCANCALGIKKQLEKKGLENVDVNFSEGEVFYTENSDVKIDEIIEEINSLGYKVVDKGEDETGKSVV